MPSKKNLGPLFLGHPGPLGDPRGTQEGVPRPLWVPEGPGQTLPLPAFKEAGRRVILCGCGCLGALIITSAVQRVHKWPPSVARPVTVDSRQ